MRSILYLLMVAAVLFFLVGIITHVLLVAKLRFRKMKQLDSSLQYDEGEKKMSTKALKKIIIGAAFWGLCFGLLQLIGEK